MNAQQQNSRGTPQARALAKCRFGDKIPIHRGLSVHMQFLNQSLSREITPLKRAATLLEKVARHIF